MKYKIFCDDNCLFEKETSFFNKDISDPDYKIILDEVYKKYKELRDINKYKVIKIYENEKIVIQSENKGEII